MKSRGKFFSPRSLTIMKNSKADMKPFLVRWMAEKKSVNITLSFTAVIDSLQPGGEIVLTPNESEDQVILIETWYKKRSITQLNTLKALEAFLYWSMEGDYPLKSELLWAIHEGIIEEADIRDQETGARIRTSSPVCTTAHMNRFIEIALNHLAEAQIGDDLKCLLFSDQPLSVLFTNWIRQRMIETDIDDIKSWAEYKSRFQFCEATFVYADDLVQAHIVSRGANAAAIDKPWNWLRIRNSIHQRQHQYGWDELIREYPHLKPKIDRAREKAGEL